MSSRIGFEAYPPIGGNIGRRIATLLTSTEGCANTLAENFSKFAPPSNTSTLVMLFANAEFTMALAVMGLTFIPPPITLTSGYISN